MKQVVIAAGTALAALGLIMSGAAQASSLPSQDAIIGSLLTVSEMKAATGYASELVSTGPASCAPEPGGALKCSVRAQATNGADPAPYPYVVNILAFASANAANTHWTSKTLKPTSFMGEKITIVTRTKTKITYVAVPASTGQMAWAWTSIKGKQGIMSAACSANSSSPNLAELARCSDKAATRLVRKVKAQRPPTQLG